MPRFDPIAHRSLKNDTDSIYIHAESCLGLRQNIAAPCSTVLL